MSIEIMAAVLKEIKVGASGTQNGAALRESLIAKYGQPRTEQGFMGEVFIWEATTAKLVLQPYLNDASAAIFTNKDVSAKIDLLIKQKAQAGASEGAKNL